MKRLFGLGWLWFLLAVLTGCGDTFRPIIIPNPPTFPDPRSSHSVVAVSDSGGINGSLSSLEVSGDTVMGEAQVGLHPVHAVQQSASEVIVVNHSSPGQNLRADSLTKISFTAGTPNISGAPVTISLPDDSAPNFVASAPADASVYVSLPNYFSPIQNAVVPSLGVVDTANARLTATVPVGASPVAVARVLSTSPAINKVYVANNGSNSVSSINVQDLSRNADITAGINSPQWLTVRSDNQRLYVLNGDGTLTTYATSNDAPIPGAVPNVGAGATHMVYDTILQRLYVPSGNQVAIVGVAQDPPVILTTIALPPIPGSPSVPSVAVGVAALPDGTRAYLASSSAASIDSQVTISSVTGDGATATYAYSLVSGHDLTSGIVINVAGTATGFDGAYLISAVAGGVFQVANPTKQATTTVTGIGSSTANYFPQVTVIDTRANTIKTTIQIPGFAAYDAACAATRFRYTMAAGGDSTRAYLATCDGGTINIIQTSSDTFFTILQAPANSGRVIVPPFTEPPPQNPVFLIAGP